MNVHFSSKTPEWATPPDFFNTLQKEFHFNLDPCATPENAKCAVFYTREQDGLAQSWRGKRIFCNPPYGREIGGWVRKCATGGGAITVALLPARTDTRWWHEHIQDKAEVRFIKGRLKFGGHKNSAPFPSCVVIWRK